jgi:hypothetical protein
MSTRLQPVVSSKAEMRQFSQMLDYQFMMIIAEIESRLLNGFLNPTE